MSQESSLTLEERLEIYRKVYAEISTSMDDSDVFICPRLRHEYFNIKRSARYYNVKIEFKEFYAQKPLFKSSESAWWDSSKKGINKRLNALTKAINMTLKKIEKVK